MMPFLLRARHVAPVAVAAVCMTAGVGTPLEAQTSLERGAVGTALALRQLDGVKRVLMIGAHPDDEDTSLLAALARGDGVETAYLALTRGDGGQNLIGPELGEGLGAVRTGELLAARGLDGGRQFFTRAFDFGYSKTAEEALSFWPREELLRDVTWVVRTFRPHVVVSIFSGTPSDGHGQHQAAGIMANEVFEVAGDPSRFPEFSARGVEPWQPSKLYRLTRRGPTGASLSIETGTFDPVLGRSHHQLAMESRSQHRSQDMGTRQPLGPRASGLTLVRAAEDIVVPEEDSFFAGVDTTFAGLMSGLGVVALAEATRPLGDYRAAIREASTSLDVFDPGRAASALGRALQELSTLEIAVASEPEAGDLVREISAKTHRVRSALVDAAGLEAELRVGDDLLVPGESVEVTLELWNGGAFQVVAARPELHLPEGWSAGPAATGGAGFGGGSPFGRGGQVPDAPEDGPVNLAAGEAVRWRYQVTVAPDEEPTRPYYLRQARDGEMYRWPDETGLWGLPKAPPPVSGSVDLTLHITPEGSGVRIQLPLTGEFVGADPAFGEYRKPVLVMPALSVAAQPRVVVWPEDSNEPRAITVAVRSFSRETVSGVVSLQAPEGWSVEPPVAELEWRAEGEERSITFSVRPRRGGREPGEHVFRARVRVDGAVYGETVQLIDYEHIERTALFHAADASVAVVPVEVREDLRVGYVMGSGDAGPEALRELGIEPALLSREAVLNGDFSQFDVLVLGIRAYETRSDLRSANDAVLAFAREGGTVLVQYNQYTYPSGDFAPYPVSISRPHDRVTDQSSPFRLLDPEAPVFRSPNRIEESDFDGWVTERGLYFLGEWSEEFTPLLELSDPGEEPKRGALAVAPVGDGVYVYTGLSFFRQLPAGVPGAYRLFANLVSLRGEDWRDYLRDRRTP